MTIDRTYRCDLCRDAYKPEEGILLGIYFESWPTKGIVQREVRNVEHHICKPCLRGLAPLVAEVTDTAFRTVTDS